MTKITLNNQVFSKKAEDVQDDIFRRMSADQRVLFGSQLWQLAKDIVGDKIRYYGNRRPAPASGAHRKDS